MGLGVGVGVRSHLLSHEDTRLVEALHESRNALGDSELVCLEGELGGERGLVRRVDAREAWLGLGLG